MMNFEVGELSLKTECNIYWQKFTFMTKTLWLRCQNQSVSKLVWYLLDLQIWYLFLKEVGLIEDKDKVNYKVTSIILLSQINHSNLAIEAYDVANYDVKSLQTILFLLHLYTIH